MNSIHWNAALYPSGVSLYPTSPESDRFVAALRGTMVCEMLEIFGSELVDLIVQNPEIQAKRWAGKQITIQWPESNPEVHAKIKRCLKRAGIQTQEVQGADAKETVQMIGTAIWTLHEAGVTLTQDLCRQLIEKASYAQEISRGIWHLHQSSIRLTNEICKFLIISGKQAVSASILLEELHRSGFLLTTGDFQLLAGNLAHIEKIYSGVSFLREENIPLARDYFLFLTLNGKDADQISLAIESLHQGGMPLTQEIRALLGSNAENAEKIAFVIERLHQTGIPLTDEISAFLSEASKEHGEMIHLIINDLPDEGIALSVEDLALVSKEKAHADVLYWTIAYFYKTDLPSSAEVDAFLALDATAWLLKRLYEKEIVVTKEIYNVLNMSEEHCKAIGQGLLKLHQTGTPLTKKNLAFLKELSRARMSAISLIIEHLHQEGVPLTEDLQALLIEITRIGANWILQRFHATGIPVSKEIQKLICETFKTRITITALAIMHSSCPFDTKICKYFANNATFSWMSHYAIEKLNQASIPLTPEIHSFLIKANRMHAEAVVSESLRLAKEGAPFVLETLHTLITEEGRHHYQMPGFALMALYEAGIPLTKETFEAITGPLLLDVLTIIVHFAKTGILTQESFNDLIAGCGERFLPILEKLKKTPELNQATWNQILSEIKEREWKPCADAAIVLAQRNRALLQSGDPGRLPPEIIGKIAGYLAPPGMARYSYRAEDVAREVEVRKSQQGK